ncbi:hypothetical protein KJ682_17365 [bacterium]|nr:hypothetical protein [bacterium]
MFRNITRTACPAALLLVLVIPVAASAGDPVDGVKDKIMIVKGEDESTTLAWTDGVLTITTEDGDRTGVTVVDLEEVGALVEGAVGDLAEVLASLQLDLHMGQDNRLNFSYEDQTIEVDVDEIMVEVRRALQAGLTGLETEHWVDHRDRGESEKTAAELRGELAELRREMKELRRELRDIKER